MTGLIGSPSIMSMFGLLDSSAEDDLDKLSIEELRAVHLLERQRLGLVSTTGTIAGGVGGGVGAVALARWLLR